MVKTITRTAGIDTGKDRFDVAVHGGSSPFAVENTPAGWQSLAAGLGEEGVGRVRIEASGSYERGVARHLQAAGFTVVVLQPLQVRAFARLHLRRAKSDRIDAVLIAACTHVLDPKEAKAADPRLDALCDQLTFIEQVEADIGRLKTRLEHIRDQRLRGLVTADIERLRARRNDELRRLTMALKSHADLARRFALVLNVPGIGERTALSLVLRMPELGDVSREQAAALAGLAPFVQQSGRWEGERHIASGRSRLRRSLYYAAALPAAFRWNPALMDLYRRLTGRGKPHAVALVACARKLLIFVDRVKAVLPQLQAALPGGVKLTLTGDRSSTIRASLGHTEQTLVISVILVVLVVLFFLRSLRATLIPAVTVPVSILGTFGMMKLFGYSLDNLSPMALTIATGFVVDDAIVVLENIARHREAGVARLEAALRGAREVSFTVVSMSLLLVAVFLPILLLGGIVGRLFQEFAIVLSIAIGVSLVLALTTTPMMCALLLGDGALRPPGRLARATERIIDGLHRLYDLSLRQALAHPVLVLATVFLTIALNVLLFAIVPKSLFPRQDGGLMMGGITADQSVSFQAMEKKLEQAQAIVQADPAVETVTGFTGSRGTNQAQVFVTLKPLEQRDASAFEVMARLRHKLAAIPGAQLMMFPMQDLFIGGRMSFAQFQYTLEGDDISALRQWSEKLTAEQIDHAREFTTTESIADIAKSFGVSRSTLYRAFGCQP